MAALESQNAALAARVESLDRERAELLARVPAPKPKTQAEIDAEFWKNRPEPPAEFMPVKLTWRPAAFGPGMVLMLRATEAPMAVTVHLGDKSRRLLLDTARAVELGHAEGFPFSPGDELHIDSDGFKPHYLHVPGA
jgi:hypothetical protein